ncbi:MAG: hypothetical protein EOO90_08485 [Pedobacter sp.]|nr:MAG: hypothetical protein EOO90_08485 [Pedobacter sp.]
MNFQLKKNLPLIATIFVILIAAGAAYYMISLKKAPYDVANFKSFSYKWGTGQQLDNAYDSESGDYIYLDNQDSLIKSNVKLRANNIIFIHNRISELGFWDLPSQLGTAKVNSGILRYELQVNYLEKSKKIVFYADYDDDFNKLDSAKQIMQVIQSTIDEAESRYKR